VKIDVVRLKENVVESFQESIPAATWGLDSDEIHYTDAIHLVAHAKKEMRVLYTKTHVKTTTECRCSRCLVRYEQVFERDFDIKYSLDNEEQHIDLTKDIREEIILGYPLKFLCKDDCLGLCAECGKNLNEGSCQCQLRTT